MQDTLHHALQVRRFEAHHHVADDDGRRLALAAQQQLLDGELEAALTRLSGEDEIVLVKRLQARVRLSALHADRDNARRWSDALAASLSHALLHAGPQDLLRFGSRAQALHAFVADVLQARSARDWAWQRLSLLPLNIGRSNSPAQRHDALLRLLADAPEEGVPLLRGLLHSALWPRLIEALDDAELRGLTQSALTRMAGPQVPGFGAEEHLEAKTERAAASAADTTADGVAGAQRPPWFAATLQAARTPPRTRWALRLGCLLAWPSLARRGPAAVDAQLRAWAAAAHEKTDGPSARPALNAQAAHDAHSGHTQPRAAPAAATVQGVAEPSSSVQDESAAATRTATGHTEHGGLLLLAPLLPASGALALLDDPSVWPAGTLPQALHQLALRLWTVAPDDPATLAFCGLAPTATAPEPLALSSDQDIALQSARKCLLQHLTDRLATSLDDGSPRSPEALAALALALVVPRRARIQFDPGWIDVHFLLRDVSTALRRAALDLDPGFLPWLGLVLRYRYE